MVSKAMVKDTIEDIFLLAHIEITPTTTNKDIEGYVKIMAELAEELNRDDYFSSDLAYDILVQVRDLLREGYNENYVWHIVMGRYEEWEELRWS